MASNPFEEDENPFAVRFLFMDFPWSLSFITKGEPRNIRASDVPKIPSAGYDISFV